MRCLFINAQTYGALSRMTEAYSGIILIAKTVAVM